MLRSQHTATLLQNGQVLIRRWNHVVGHGHQPPLYDPASNTFSATGSMANARYSHTSTLLPDGTVLIAGGTNNPSTSGLGQIASAELFDPSSGTFSSVGNMTTPRAFHGAVLLPSGLVLVAGGTAPPTNAITAAELYDPTSATFSPTTLAIAFHIGGGGSPPAPAILLNNGMVLWAGGQLGPSISAGIVFRALRSQQQHVPADHRIFSSSLHRRGSDQLSDGHIREHHSVFRIVSK